MYHFITGLLILGLIIHSSCHETLHSSFQYREFYDVFVVLFVFQKTEFAYENISIFKALRATAHEVNFFLVLVAFAGANDFH